MGSININEVNRGPANTDNVTLNGNLVMPAGKGVQIPNSGTGTFSGQFTANGATGVVITTSAAAVGNIVAFSVNTPAGTQGAIPKVITVVAGVSFSVAATASDTSLYNWAIVATVV